VPLACTRKHGPGDRKAAMERREAPAFSRESAATEDWCAAWRSIPSIWFEGYGKPAPASGRMTAYPAPQRNRAMMLGCLTIESVRDAARATHSARSRASGNPVLGPRFRGDERKGNEAGNNSGEAMRRGG